MPIVLDELQDRDVVIVGVIYISPPDVGRDHHQRNTWTISKEGERLNIAGVVVATGLIERDEDRCVLKDFGVTNHIVHNVRGEDLKQGQRRGSRVSIIVLIRLDEGHGWQRVMRHILLELLEVLDVVPERGGHDRGGILERITNGAEERSHIPVVIPLTVILPRYMMRR